MGRIPDDIIQQIRDRVDVVDLVGRYVTLKQAGRSYKGLCPFHDEKTPSFNVNPDRQSYYCFGCHEGGNAFGFLMALEKLSFPDAVRTLGREVGIEVPEVGGAPGRDGLAERLFAANELAQRAYRRAFAAPDNPAAAYAAGRGLDAETLERFGIGFAPDRWDFISDALRRAGIATGVGEQAGLLAEGRGGSHYDRLRGRITFPIRDVRGRVVAFGGRALAPAQEPKYLNTAESPLFRKREAFFGFPAALEPIRRADRAVVVEGYFDLIALHRAELPEALATCGTALTREHARELRRRTRNVVLLFDGDEAGQRAIARSLEVLLPAGLRVRAAALPAGEDPDSFLTREGAAALRALVGAAPPVFDAVIQRAVAGGCRTPWEKADAVGAVAPLVALIESPVERVEVARQLALAAGTDPQHVLEAIRAAARGGDAREAVPVPPRRAGPEERSVRLLARSLVLHPALASRVPRERVEDLLPAGAARELVLALVGRAAGGAVDLDALAEQLDDEPRRLLRSLAADDFEIDADAAARTIDDTLARLERLRQRERKRSLTSQLREGNADVAMLLQQKQEQLAAERRRMNRPPPGS